MLITNAVDNSSIPFFLFFRENKTWHSCESSAMQMIHMKFKVLFFLKNYKNKLKCLLQLSGPAIFMKLVASVH